LYVKWHVSQGSGAVSLYLDTEDGISKTEPSAMPGVGQQGVGFPTAGCQHAETACRHGIAL